MIRKDWSFFVQILQAIFWILLNMFKVIIVRKIIAVNKKVGGFLVFVSLSFCLFLDCFVVVVVVSFVFFIVLFFCLVIFVVCLVIFVVCLFFSLFSFGGGGVGGWGWWVFLVVFVPVFCFVLFCFLRGRGRIAEIIGQIRIWQFNSITIQIAVVWFTCFLCVFQEVNFW